MSVLFLPHKFKFRDYQKEVYKALFVENKKRLVSIWHRRSGKSINCTSILLMAALRKRGRYYHAFPKATQAREAIWDGVDNDGIPYVDRIPKSLLGGKPRDKTMEIPLINGSTIRLIGVDNYNNLMGGNPAGAIMDEYSLMNPRAWDYLRPIFAANKNSFVYFVYTPRGHNHGYDLYNSAIKNGWFHQLLTIEDTKDNHGYRVFTDEMLKEERESGMAEEMIQQEYFCSFDASLVGSLYGDQIKQAREENRIRDFVIDRRYPVFTFWDIGRRDPTAIWFMQFIEGKYYMINYYENTGYAIDHYAKIVKDFQKKYNLKYQEHYGPHDVRNETMFNVMSNIQIAKREGIRFNVIPKTKSVMGDINITRSVFNNVVFHKTNCEYGIRCLSEYHKKWQESRKCFSDAPDHDWSSHGADAFRYFAVTFNPRINNNESLKIIGY